jgi:hypothetical protein
MKNWVNGGRDDQKFQHIAQKILREKPTQNCFYLKHLRIVLGCWLESMDCRQPVQTVVSDGEIGGLKCTCF